MSSRPVIMRFFAYDHLPPQLQEVSRPFYDIACRMLELTYGQPEQSAMLRKLLEAKDCAVRAALPPE